MDRKEFNLLLKNANLSKKEFCEIIGLNYNTVNTWGSSKINIPKWVKSWLENYIKVQKNTKEEDKLTSEEILETLSKIEVLMKNNKFKDILSVLNAIESLNEK